LTKHVDMYREKKNVPAHCLAVNFKVI